MGTLHVPKFTGKTTFLTASPGDGDSMFDDDDDDDAEADGKNAGAAAGASTETYELLTYHIGPNAQYMHFGDTGDQDGFFEELYSGQEDAGGWADMQSREKQFATEEPEPQ